MAVRRAGLLSAVLMIMATVSARGQEEIVIGPFQKSHVWPIAGTEKLDVLLRGTFGPRLLGSEGFRYDFHRGLDIKAPKGTPVRAIADGEVRIAGQPEGYRAPLVQIRHFKPERTSCNDGGCYYSNYMSLSEVQVQQGDQVKQGDVVGLTGWSKNNFEHLDFEIRDGGPYQRHAIHPLALLPYENRTAPEIEITRFAPSPAKTIVEVRVRVPSTEADFNRLEVRLFPGPQPGAEPLDEAVYDLTQWNLRYSPKDKSPDPLEEPRFQGVDVTPLARRTTEGSYEWTIAFDKLKGVPAGGKRPSVRVRAFDVQGKSSEASR